MTVGAGTHLGPYEVVAAIGAGGMGQVYRARDKRLGRDVAIKVIAPSLAADPDRVRRFELEARAAAALNHPNILAVYDVGTHDGVPYVVSELLQGTTLRGVLKPGPSPLAARPLPMRKAVEIASQIARGLAAAHDRGIVHRDLKPENIFVTTDGVVKILDFGLAKLTESSSDETEAEATHAADTQPGLVLGTMGYMAPEQVRGLPVDHRADLFAFGAVLYEMLSGHRAFPGDTPADSMTAILEKSPADLAQADRHVSPALSRLVDRCLEKTPAARFQSTRDLAFALEASQSASGVDTASNHAPERPRRTYRWPLVAGGLLVATLGLAWPAVQHLREAPGVAPVSRFEIATPPTPDAFPFALSPDGRSLAFIAINEATPQIWIRSFDQVAARPVPATENAMGVFWSPDGRSIGFFADGKLKKIGLAGGAAQILAEAPNPRGGTWNRNDIIVFAPATAGVLAKVSASAAGGAVSAVTRLEPSQTSHRWPQFLPDGRHFLFVSGVSGTAAIYRGSLDSAEITQIIEADAAAAYAAGRLLYVSQGALLARLFNPDTGVLSGDPVPIAQPVGVDGVLLRSAFTVSETGVLAHRLAGAQRRQLVWADRTGRVTGTLGALDDTGLANPGIAPDGRVAASRNPQGNADVWIFDARGVPSRFTFNPAVDSQPLWSPDSRTIYFRSSRNGQYDLFQKPADMTTDERLLLKTDQSKSLQDVSRDGRFLLYTSRHPTNGSDVWALPLTGDDKPFPVAQSPFDEFQAQFSPDGRWIAYVSNESGANDVYVRTFPGEGGKRQISTGGGVAPRWGRDGSELFYLAPDRRLVAIPLRFGPDGRTVDPDPPHALFASRLGTGANIAPTGFDARPQYAVGRDGRFLLNIAAEQPAAPPIVVVLNWPAGVGKK